MLWLHISALESNFAVDCTRAHTGTKVDLSLDFGFPEHFAYVYATRAFPTAFFCKLQVELQIFVLLWLGVCVFSVWRLLPRPRSDSFHSLLCWHGLFSKRCCD